MSDVPISQNPKSMAFIGAGILTLGTFVPIVSLPIVGNVNYFANGEGDGMLLVVLAAITAVLAFLNQTKHVLWSGLAAALMIAWALIRFANLKSEMQAQMDEELAGNPFRGLAEVAVQSVQLQWGWIVLIAGAGIIIYAGLKARNGIEVSTKADGES